MDSSLYSKFTNHDKSLLIAPAWYWKTHTIVESIRDITSWKALVLTHTHAWVAVIKDRLKKSWIEKSKYNVETISSYAMKYVNAFYVWDDIPNQENVNEYFSFILEKSLVIFSQKEIKKIIEISYSHLFIDEYQDCWLIHHKVIVEISEVLNTHILWDPLQGIFNFNEMML
jgi:DNA helicase-2/ATP-dependent DNA helicase PcrA